VTPNPTKRLPRPGELWIERKTGKVFEVDIANSSDVRAFQCRHITGFTDREAIFSKWSKSAWRKLPRWLAGFELLGADLAQALESYRVRKETQR
jgi:hypothetical protein